MIKDNIKKNNRIAQNNRIYINFADCNDSFDHNQVSKSIANYIESIVIEINPSFRIEVLRP